MIIILIWVACGLVAAGGSNAHFRGRYPSLNSISDRRETLGFSLIWGLIGGPIALLACVFLTGFFVHGWTLSDNPVDGHDE